MRNEVRAERSSMETAPEHLERDKFRASITDYVSAAGVAVMVAITVAMVVMAMMEGTFL